MKSGSWIGKLTGFVKKQPTGFVKKLMGDAWRMLVALGVFLVLPGLAYLFLRPESDGTEESSDGSGVSAVDFLDLDRLVEILGITPADSKTPAVDVLDWLEKLPMEPAFLYLVAAIAGAYMGWRWWLSANLVKEIRTREGSEDKSTLTPRDWWVVQKLRGRALTLRTLAGLLLGGVIALLFGGIYFVLFAIPQFPERDRFLVEEIQQRANFKLRFDHRLQLIGEGRYWFKTVDVSLQDDVISEEVRLLSGLLSRIPPVGTALPRLPVLNTHELSKGELAILAAGYGGASVTRDGGRTWSTPQGLKLKKTERLVTAAFDADGAHA